MNEGMNQCDKKAKKTRHREKISSLSGGKVATLRAQTIRKCRDKKEGFV